MTELLLVSRSRELLPGIPLGKLSQSFPWGIPYLFSYENKARDCSHSSRARFRAHLKFAQAPEVGSAMLQIGGTMS